VFSSKTYEGYFLISGEKCFISTPRQWMKHACKNSTMKEREEEEIDWTKDDKLKKL